MNHFLTPLFLFALAFGAFAQPPTERRPREEDPIETVVDESARFPGGYDIMMKYLADSLKYPERALKEKIQGEITVRIVVEKGGTITQIRIAHGVPNCPECDKEALRVIRAMPKWIPAKNDGKPVRSYFDLSVTFRLPSKNPKKVK